MSMPLTVADLELPALSVAVPVTDWSAPSLLSVVLPTQVAMSDSPSAQVKLTVTAALYQPFRSATRSGAPLMVGNTVSMSMSVTVAVLVLPAASVAVPTTNWPAPSLLNSVSPTQEATPDRLSSQVKLTLTAPLFQPKPFATGRRLPSMDGAVASSLMVTETGPTEPPALDAEQL